MKSKTNQRTLQAIKTKKKIYRISISLINERGYDSVTVDDICSAAGISKGAFYHHFKSKQDIISQVETLLNDSISDVFDLNNSEITIREQVMLFINSLLTVPEKSGLEITRQRTRYIVGGEYALESEVNTFSVYSRKMLKDFFQSAVDKGEMRKDAPVEMLTETIMVLIAGLIFDWCIFSGNFSLTEKGWKMANFLVTKSLDPYIIQPNS